MPTSAARAPASAANLNLPLPRKSGDDVFLEALEAGMRRIRSFAPEALVVALGLDAFEGDPFGGLSVTTPGFARIAETIAALQAADGRSSRKAAISATRSATI